MRAGNAMSFAPESGTEAIEAGSKACSVDASGMAAAPVVRPVLRKVRRLSIGYSHLLLAEKV
jgi:hypothetical protein